MGKRLMEATRFKNHRWYRLLDPYYKLAWEYVNSSCDPAGMWKINCPDLLDDLRLPNFDLKKFVAACNTDYDILTGEIIEVQRLVIHRDTSLWITSYIKEQHESKDCTINPFGLYAKAALLRCADYGVLYIALTKGYIPLHISIKKLNQYLQALSKGDGIPFERAIYNEIDNDIIGIIYNSELRENKGVKGGKGGEPRKTVPASPDEPPGEGDCPSMSRETFEAFETHMLKDDQVLVEGLMVGRQMKNMQEFKAYQMRFRVQVTGESKIISDYGEYKRYFKNYVRNVPEDIPRVNGKNHKGDQIGTPIPEVTAAQLAKYK